MAARRKTNVELVMQIMEVSNRGGLTQVFVLEAIERYARQVAEASPKAVAKAFERQMVSGAAWQDVARDILRQFQQHWADPSLFGGCQVVAYFDCSILRDVVEKAQPVRQEEGS